MMLDLTAFLACLFSGIWCWRALRRLGLGRLAAAALTCLGLYAAQLALLATWLALGEAWQALLILASDLAVPLGTCLVVLLGGVTGWKVWEHRQARRFFRP